MLTWDTQAAIKKVSAGLSKGLFEQGITDITYAKSQFPVYKDNPKGFYVRKINKDVLIDENFFLYDGWKYYEDFNKFLKDFNDFNVIHIQSNQWAKEIDLLKQFPKVYTCHCSIKIEQEVEGKDKSLVFWHQDKLIHDSDVVQVMNLEYERIIREYHDYHGRIVIIPNGRDFKNHREIKRDEEKTMLSIGRLNDIKGHKYLIEALPKIKEIYPNFKLYIGSDGSLKNSLENRINDLGLNENVEFLGWLNEKGLEPFYKKANLFVLPSLHENDPNVLLEAIDYYLPFICTDTGGLKQLYKDKEDCLKVQIKDPNSIFNAVIYAFENPEKMKGYARNARKNNEYRTWKNIAGKMIDVYQDLLREPVKSS